jgi:hypothetical protein
MSSLANRTIELCKEYRHDAGYRALLPIYARILTPSLAVCLESADAFLEFAQAFLGAGVAEAVGDFL